MCLDIRRKLRQLEKGPESPQRDLLEAAFKVFNNREEEAKREKDRKRKAKYAFLVAAIKGRDQPSPSDPRPGLRNPLDPASDATSQDPGQRHARTHGPPQKLAQPVVSGDTGRWTVPRDALAPLGRSHLPDLESGMSTATPWCPWGDPHFSPEPQPNPMRVVPMTGPGFQPPGLCPEHELGTSGRRGGG